MFFFYVSHISFSHHISLILFSLWQFRSLSFDSFEEYWSDIF